VDKIPGYCHQLMFASRSLAVGQSACCRENSPLKLPPDQRLWKIDESVFLWGLLSCYTFKTIVITEPWEQLVWTENHFRPFRWKSVQNRTVTARRARIDIFVKSSLTCTGCQTFNIRHEKHAKQSYCLLSLSPSGSIELHSKLFCWTVNSQWVDSNLNSCCSSLTVYWNAIIKQIFTKFYFPQGCVKVHHRNGQKQVIALGQKSSYQSLKFIRQLDRELWIVA